MKTRNLLTSNIRENWRNNTHYAKKLQRLNADPNRFYDGPTHANEDYADSVKLGAIKAIRLG
ncbi:hypothetical protein AB1282_00470 [Gottfriedia sp. S16(2024)]|uniref:hypothetical protein n=1 Tax=Gottfriedia sp. S16(2024) TaxID=3162883 RepID=UPI003D19A2B4